MGESNRHTIMMDDDAWEWVAQFAEETGEHRSDVIERAVKVYAGKMASGEWVDPRYKDKYDKKIQELVGGK